MIRNVSTGPDCPKPQSNTEKLGVKNLDIKNIRHSC